MTKRRTDRHRGPGQTGRQPPRPGGSRLRWLTAGGLAVWLCLAGRLVQVQGVQHSRYVEQAREQHERWVEQRGLRGRILDRQGTELAADVQATSFYCDPHRVRRPAEVASHFARLGGREEAALLKLLDSSRRFVYLLRQADAATATAARAHHFEGVFELPETRRYYPYGELAAQVVGFTDVDNRGREGLEFARDQALAEHLHRARCSVDAHGQPVPGRRPETAEPRNGNSLTLTIDAAYQGILEEELSQAVLATGAEAGMGIISDPQTGEILAAANVPLFDPNQPGRAPATHRRNRTITDAFEPGSTFKVIAAAAVLEEGVASPDSLVYCEDGAMVLATGDTLRDVGAHGWLSMREAESSNIGVIKLASRLERRTYNGYLRNFGFGSRTGIGLPAESAGVLRPARDWSDRSLQTIAIGQEVSVTALQLVQAFGAIANGGMLMAPLVVSAVTDPDSGAVRPWSPQPVRRVISGSTANQLRDMLTGVVDDGSGSRAQIAGVRVAGKTGTAQRAAPGGAGYVADECVSSFVGFLPAENPQLLCLIVIDNPRTEKWGGQVAAPVFQQTMQRVLDLDWGAGAPETLASAPAGEPLPAGDMQGPAENPLPHLLGMTPALARYHCGLRGMRAHFTGVGDMVVSQDPSPGIGVDSPQHVVCQLGSAWEISGRDMGATPARQTILVRKLGNVWSRHLAAL